MKKHNENQRHPVIVVALVSIIILGGVSLYNYRVPVEDKEFSFESFYQGNRGKSINPKSIYSILTGNNILSTNACVTEFTAADASLCGTATWIVSSRYNQSSPTSREMIDLMRVDETDITSAIRPYKYGSYIVAPCNLTFIDSNVLQDEENITITAYVNDETSGIVLKWQNVKCWWCHIGKNNPNQHTAVVGKGGVNELCVAGMILGQATADTTFEVLRVVDGIYVNQSVSAWFFNVD